VAFESYLSYDEYKELGGKVPEDVFPMFERKARRKIDSITFDRVQSLDTVPTEVKELMVEFVSYIYSNEISTGGVSNASSYSNGVESFSFRDNASSKFNNELVKLAIEYLPEYLTARSVNFDVKQYLQSKNNNS
jgi:hypothetical protein